MVIPSAFASMIWSWIILVNGQITKTQAFALFSSSFATTKDWKIKLFLYPVGSTARTSWFQSKLFTDVTCCSFSWNRTFAVAWNFVTTSEIQVCHVDFQLLARFDWQAPVKSYASGEIKFPGWKWKFFSHGASSPYLAPCPNPLAAHAEISHETQINLA